MGVVLSLADGTSTISESIWDSRFQYTDELNKMGAKITAQGKIAFFEGVKKLSGAPVYSTDLRAGAALVIAGTAAEGLFHDLHQRGRRCGRNLRPHAVRGRCGRLRGGLFAQSA